MSRALDKGVKEALENGNHEKIFEDISAVLTQPSGSLLEIELLGQSHLLEPGTTFLQDGNAVAIPKLRLVQAFIHARQTLFRCLQANENHSNQDIRKATAVVLLMDPEHLTAANARKRFLTSSLPGAENAAKILHDEKFFIDSLLTSRLHRHTKSPILWSHRRWLTEQFLQVGIATDIAEDLKSVVFVAAERHPRNYYAWCHARHLINSVDPGNKQPGPNVSTVMADTKRWCFSHYDDVSGWMFLLFLLRRWPQEATSTVTETLKLAESFHWRNESVWYFLRNMMLSVHVARPQEDQFQSVWQALRKDTQDNSQGRKVLDGASKWVETYSAKPYTSTRTKH
ncbi:Protein prenyltransferase alpha subunit repeat-containing protein 1-B [Tolypocladium ophioglossoides CBS 100239]|uniref:Protein prenyltransferase alpha subunit repeat-containing protein 1-B n=1 Tax=Tolypocladium ophioglossoides (strain CBS 100239) TaxID=1163406 RepID=A0A0L0NFH9_TOLOC|nr:Protein prenyltransferase alpha subunit repeat-containing protein 1-B [Tolypocladium ophioglossoides CBS 100239]